LFVFLDSKNTNFVIYILNSHYYELLLEIIKSLFINNGIFEKNAMKKGEMFCWKKIKRLGLVYIETSDLWKCWFSIWFRSGRAGYIRNWCFSPRISHFLMICKINWLSEGDEQDQIVLIKYQINSLIFAFVPTSLVCLIFFDRWNKSTLWNSFLIIPSWTLFYSNSMYCWSLWKEFIMSEFNRKESEIVVSACKLLR
jgi:hypothetical protein